MGIIIDEQPPESTAPELREWLNRLAMQLNIDNRIRSVQGGDPNIDGLFMRWTGQYVPGKRYYPGEVVSQDGFTMICINPTEDQAAPQPDGPPTWGLPDVPLWEPAQLFQGRVDSGHSIVLNQEGWIKSVRVWVSEVDSTASYRVILKGLPVGDFFVIENPLLTEDDWTEIIRFSNYQFGNEQFSIELSGFDDSTSALWNHDWIRQANDNAVTPLAGFWNINNPGNTLRINTTDDAAEDQATDLAVVIPGSEITMVQDTNITKTVKFLINSTLVAGPGYWEWDMNIIDTNNGGPDVGELCHVLADIPISNSTEYVTLLNNWPAGNPAWGTFEGLLEYDQVDQPGNEVHAFGVDLEFQPSVSSPDWEIISLPEV